MIQYTHKTHPRSRSIKIKIEGNGEVVVVTPKRFSQRAVDRFVTEQAAWIETNRAKAIIKTKFSETTTELAVFGKHYQKQVVDTNSFTRGVAIKGNQLIINVFNPDRAQHYIDRFLKNTAEQYIVPRTHQLAETMQINFARISLKQQKTRWGSCSSQGNLHFNWRLVHSPPDVIDYVIIHELAHRKHMDHSRAFWNLVAQFDPAYSEHRGWLKRHGMSVG